MCCEKKKKNGPSCSYTKQESYTGHNERVMYSFSFSAKDITYFHFFYNCYFFICYLGDPRPTWTTIEKTASRTLCCLRYVNYRPEDHREPRNEVRSLSLAECLGGFDSSDSFTMPQPFRPLSPCNTYLK